MTQPTLKPSVTHLATMKALIAKDVRYYRVPMLALLITGSTCYVVAVIAVLSSHTDDKPRQFMAALEVASGFATMVVGLIAAAFGGIALAGERADRTAEFMEMLPVRRFQIVLSKCLVSLSMLFICLVFHMTVAMCLIDRQMRSTDLVYTLAVIDGLSLSCYGVAWLLGSFLKSGPVSACVAIGVTVSSALLSTTTVKWFSSDLSHREPLAIAIVTAWMGLASLIVGSLHYARKIAP